MTVVAAAASETSVILGSDIATTGGGTSILSAAANGKIETILVYTADGPERILIASAGACGIRGHLRRHLTIGGVPADPADTESADMWADATAEAITGVLADARPPIITDSSDGNGAQIDGGLLLAWRQHLWVVTTHAALRPGPLAAIGAGSDVALGALHAATQLGANPIRAVDQAVRIACSMIDGCRIDHRGPRIRSTLSPADLNLEATDVSQR